MAFQGIAPISFNSPSMVTTSLGSNDGEVGTLRTQDGRTYRLVYNAGNSQITVGAGVTLSGVSGYSVTVSTTVSNMVGVGVCYHATIPTAAYGYVLVEGFGKYKAAANSTVAAGDTLALAGDGTWVMASGITGNAYGKAMAATASAGVGEAYFRF